MKSRRQPKYRIKIGQPVKKPLSVRYAEVVRLREAILKVQSGNNINRAQQSATE